MPYTVGAPLFRPSYRTDSVTGNVVPNPSTTIGKLIYDGTFTAEAAGFVASGNATIEDPTPGVDGSGYPGFTSASGTYVAYGLAIGDVIRVTGAANSGNGTDGSPKTFRVAYLGTNQRSVGVEGPSTSGMVEVGAPAAYRIRKIRPWRVADIRSVSGAAHPITVQASSITNLDTTYIYASLDDGATWDRLPKVLLPDPDNSSAKIIQFFVGYEALLMVMPPTNYTGKLYVA